MYDHVSPAWCNAVQICETEKTHAGPAKRLHWERRGCARGGTRAFFGRGMGKPAKVSACGNGSGMRAQQHHALRTWAQLSHLYIHGLRARSAFRRRIASTPSNENPAEGGEQAGVARAGLRAACYAREEDRYGVNRGLPCRRVRGLAC